MVNAKILGEGIPTEFQTSSNTIVFDGFYNVNLEKFNQVLCLELNTTSKQNVLDVIKVLEKRPDIKYAGPDYVITMYAAADDVPTINSQWAVDRIQLPEASEIASGNDVVIVGVIDSGIDGNHPYLANSILDISYHRDYSTGSVSNVSVLEDSDGHGTAVAGIIVAVEYNGTDIVGTRRNIKLVSLKVFDSNRQALASSVAQAIEYAYSRGIPILNFSGGFYGSVDPESNFDQALYEVIDSYTGLFICASGNNGWNNDLHAVFPANYHLDNLIAVGASTSDDHAWGYSNFGEITVDLFAPGEGVLTCYPDGRCGNCDPTVCPAPGYHYVDGTSFAAPFVTGVAALILTTYPDMPAAQIKDRIMISVDTVYDDDTDVYVDKCISGGRLNAYKALHDHSFTISPYSSVKHMLACSCGVVMYDGHTLEDVVVTLPSGQTMVASQCAICGYLHS